MTTADASADLVVAIEDGHRPERLDAGTPASLSCRQRRSLLGVLLVVISAAAFNAGGHTYSIDNEVQLQTTRSLVQLKPTLESIDAVWANAPNGPYVKRDDGEYVGVYGIGFSVLSAPLYAVSRGAAQFVDASDRDLFIRTGTLFTNAFVLGGIVVVMTLLGRELGGSFRVSLLVALAYAFTTYALPHAKTYFTELASALFVCLAALLAMRAARLPAQRWALACGGAAGFGVLVRTTAAIFVVIVLVWLVVTVARYRGVREGSLTAFWYCAGGAGPLAVFLLMNWWRYGSPTDLGYQNVPQDFPLLEGVSKLMFTPGKSIFLYAPVIVVGLVGMAVGVRRASSQLALLSALIAGNVVVFSRVPFWSGDAAWGPRYQQIVLPLLCVPAVLAADRRWWRPALASCMVIGFALPVALGSLVYFNSFFVAVDASGASHKDVIETIEWNPFLGHLELISPAMRDVLDANHPDEYARGPYSDDPASHYGYFSVEPRVDVWWLWVEPTAGSNAEYLYLVPILSGAAIGLWLLLSEPRGGATRVGKSDRIRSSPTDRFTLDAPKHHGRTV